jgi:hypothetical protein
MTSYFVKLVGKSYTARVLDFFVENNLWLYTMRDLKRNFSDEHIPYNVLKKEVQKLMRMRLVKKVGLKYGLNAQRKSVKALVSFDHYLTADGADRDTADERLALKKLGRASRKR